MQMVKKTAAVMLFIWFAMILFMPKGQIYFSLERELSKNDIVLNEESRSEGIFSLRLQNVTVYVKGIPLATIDEVDIFTLLFFTSIHFESFVIDETLQTMIPTNIEHLHITQTIFMPLDLSIEAEGSFGKASGNINLGKRVLHIGFDDIQTVEMLKPQLKQGEEGWYYETSF